ncbi:27059_t:CDS:2, partial [Dentiscutata erythropus]
MTFFSKKTFVKRNETKRLSNRVCLFLSKFPSNGASEEGRVVVDRCGCGNGGSWEKEELEMGFWNILIPQCYEDPK